MNRDTTTTTSQDILRVNSLRLVGLDGLPDHSRQSSYYSGSNQPLISPSSSPSPSPSRHSSPASFNFSQPIPRQRQWQRQGQLHVQTQGQGQGPAQDPWGLGSFKRTSLETVADEEPAPDPEPAAKQAKSPRFYASLPPSMTLSTTSIPTTDTESNHKRSSKSSASLYTQGGTSRNASTSRHSLYQPKPSSPVKTELCVSDDDNSNDKNNSNAIIGRRQTRKLMKRKQRNPEHTDITTTPAPKTASDGHNKSFFRSLGKLLGVSQGSS